MANLRIISSSSKPFRDRREAGKLLGQELSYLGRENVVVLGIPRGGVVVARELATVLQADLDIVLSRKLPTPGHEELAMGSVSEDGKVFLNETVVRELDIDASFIEQAKKQQLSEIARRIQLFRPVRPKVNLRGRTVVITDDGIATGSTMQAALWMARHEHPKKLIAAVPVAAKESLLRLAHDADEMFCLRAPPFFGAVGQFYLEFYPVEDSEVLAILREEGKRISTRTV